MTKEQIGAILKELRVSCGFTQKEVAEKIGRKQQIIGHWETGYSQPDANTLFVLCNIYGTTVDEAFGFSKKTNGFSPEDALLIKKYRSLDDRGRAAVDVILEKEHEYSTAEQKPETPAPVSIVREPEPDDLIPNAAHEIPGASKEAKAAADALIDNNAFWK